MPAKPHRLHSMAEDVHRVVGFLYFVGFFVYSRCRPDVSGTSKMTGEQRTCSMAAHPNGDSTLNWRKSSASSGDGACV